MVDIVHRGLKEIVVFEHARYRSVDELARVASLEAGGLQPPVLRWANGIAFRTTLPQVLLSSDHAAKELTENGRLHVSIDYAEMPHFKPTVNAAEERVVIPVLDETPSPVSLAIVDWLKNRKG